MKKDKRSLVLPNKCIQLIASQDLDKEHLKLLKVDYASGIIEFAYDPEHISKQEIYKAAGLFSATMQLALKEANFQFPKKFSLKGSHPLEKRSGIRKASASFKGGLLRVTFDHDPSTQAALKHYTQSYTATDTPLAGKEATKGSKWQSFKSFIPSHEAFEIFLVSLSLLSCLTIFFLQSNQTAPYLLNVIYLIAYVSGGWLGVRCAIDSLKQKSIDVDVLMLLAAIGAALIGAPLEGAVLLFLFSLSHVLSDYAFHKARHSINGLIRLRPTKALVFRESVWQRIPVEQVQIGEQIRSDAGEQIPLDGIISEGLASVDQSSITGESLPLTKETGDFVFAGSLNTDGSLTITATHKAEDSTLARVLEFVKTAQAKKAKSQRFLERYEKRYALFALCFSSSLVFILPLLFGLSFQEAFYRALTVIVVASPCALIISTPASILAALSNGASKGILFKGGAHLENLAHLKTLAFDKTGTLTKGRLKVHSIELLEASFNEDSFLSLAGSLESHSNHPIGKAIVKEAKDRHLPLKTVKNFKLTSGLGVQGTLGEAVFYIGSFKWLKSKQLDLTLSQKTTLEGVLEQGKSLVLLAKQAPNSRLNPVGFILLADEVRPEAKASLQALRKAGIQKLFMLTGDHKKVARELAEELGLDAFYAELLPEEKSTWIGKLNKENLIGMVGDGINDAPALSYAHVGIAMGAGGNDVALESADVVLMSNDLSKLPFAISLGRRAYKIVCQNLIFSGFIVFMMVLLTLLLPSFGITIPLWLAVLIHEGSTVLVCLNGLRLLYH